MRAHGDELEPVCIHIGRRRVDIRNTWRAAEEVLLYNVCMYEFLICQAPLTLLVSWG